MKTGLPKGTDTGPAACHEFFEELFEKNGITWDPIVKEEEESKRGAEKNKTYTFEVVDIPYLLSDALKEKGDLNWVSNSERGKAFLAFMESELTKLRDASRFKVICIVVISIVVFGIAPSLVLLFWGSLSYWAIRGFSQDLKTSCK